MKVLIGGYVMECALEGREGEPAELVPTGGGDVSFPAPGMGLALVEATPEERDALVLAGFRLPEVTSRREDVN